MAQKKETLNEIRTSMLSRGLSLARASIRAGSVAANQWLNDKGDGTQAPIWMAQVEAVIRELGQLKGTAMKVGQTLSMYGEHLLPKEVNDVLKTLQQNSQALAWPAIKAIIEKELGAERFAELEIEETALASASIGQVHRARVKATGEVLALKVQYPGVDRAVETDLKLLKFILNVSDLVPRGPRFDQIFEEIREMFYQEIDYRNEFKFGEQFRELLKGDPRYIVPKAHARYSTSKLFASEFVEGVRADSAQAQALPVERRNRLGMAFFDVYLKELFDVRLMQTDPHLGNYLIQIAEDGNDKLVLLDFGAMRVVPADFLRTYAMLVEGGLKRDGHTIEKGGRRLNLLLPEDPMTLVEDYVQLCLMLTEPFSLPEWNVAPPTLLAADGSYDWGASDLPKRCAVVMKKVATNYKLRAPPRELIFLDRKLGGVFIFMSVLKCQLNARPTLERALAGYLKADAPA
jgi:predicted unusual protein kinase regulating ubiquinone biosynthesis (AarF/ABC1/UbiB family)